MAFTKALLVDLAAENGRDELIEQGDFSTQLVDFKMKNGEQKNPAKVFEKLYKPTEFGRVNPIVGGIANAGVTGDGLTRRAPGMSTPAAGKYQYSMVEGDIEFFEGVTRVVRGGDGIDAAMEQIGLAGQNIARIIERSLINHKLAATEATESIGSAVTVEIDDISGVRPNMLVDIFASNGTTVRQLDATITSVADDGDGTGSVVISSLTANLSIGDLIFIAGTSGGAAPTSPLSGTGNRSVNIADLTESSYALYDGLSATDQPAGVQDSTTTAWSNAAGKRMMQRVFTKCAKKPTHLLVHPYQEQKLYEAQNQTLQFRSGDTLDAYGPRMLFDKAEVVVSNSQKPKRVDFLNCEKFTAQYHEFWEPSPVGDGGKGGGWSRDALQLSQQRHSWILFISAGYNMRVRRRDAFGAMTALNAAF